MLQTAHRTITRDQLVFNLGRPHPVIFDFSDLPSDGLKITIPPYSSWREVLHWHYTSEACEDIWTLSGHYSMVHGIMTNPGGGSGTGGGPDHMIQLRLEEGIYWLRDGRRPEYESEPVVVSYRFRTPEAYVFYRQICSVDQDAEIYFHLQSTPLWLRFLYMSWGLVPFLGKRIQASLLAWCLWIQLRVIYVKNDYWTYEGRIPYTKRWLLDPGYQFPPQKWVDKELKSIIMLSRWVRNSCHWVGTRILGMKESYPEYQASKGSSIDTKSELTEL